MGHNLLLISFQLKASGSKVHLISMVRHDAETVFQQIKELGMTGKGWVWIGTDGATSSTFHQQKDLQRAMEGMIGTQPKNGEGSVYLKFLANWIKKDSTTYPGIVHSKPVSLLLEIVCINRRRFSTTKRNSRFGELHSYNPNNDQHLISSYNFTT